MHPVASDGRGRCSLVWSGDAAPTGAGSLDMTVEEIAVEVYWRPGCGACWRVAGGAGRGRGASGMAQHLGGPGCECLCAQRGGGQRDGADLGHRWAGARGAIPSPRRRGDRPSRSASGAGQSPLAAAATRAVGHDHHAAGRVRVRRRFGARRLELRGGRGGCARLPRAPPPAGERERPGPRRQRRSGDRRLGAC